MEKLILKFSVLALACALAACGQKKEDDVNGLDSYTTVDGQFSQKDTNAIEGTGSVRFNTILPGIISNKYVEIRGSVKPNGSVAVVMNSDDLSLADGKGVIFQIFRSGTDPLKVQPSGRILVQGVGVGISDGRLAYINASDFDLIVEVHNTQTSTRVLVWRKEVLTYNLASLDVDTATPAHLTGNFPGGSGQGVFAGLKLVNAKVTAAQINDAKVTLP